MNNPSAKPASPGASKELMLSLLLGGVLGQFVSAMAESQPGDMFSFVMAVVCVVSASASLVTYLLAQPARTGRAPNAPRMPLWLLAIGGGLLLVLQASPL